MTDPSLPSVKARAAARQWLIADALLGVSAVPVLPTPAPASVAVAAPAAPTARPAAAERSAAAAAPLAADPAGRLRALEARYRTEVADAWTEYAFSNPVFGEGPADARLMVVGEGPGGQEDRVGRPFVGPAGKKLDDMLAAIDVPRERTYIANVVKIRAPGDRTPLAGEVARCEPFLREQISIIRPRVILALGGPATKWLLRTTTGITRLRGVWGRYEDEAVDPPVAVDVMPSFHPAYLLRNYTREVREKMWHDLQAVRTRLADAAAVDGP